MKMLPQPYNSVVRTCFHLQHGNLVCHKINGSLCEDKVAISPHLTPPNKFQLLGARQWKPDAIHYHLLLKADPVSWDRYSDSFDLQRNSKLYL